MTAMTLPISRAAGRTLIVAPQVSREALSHAVEALGHIAMTADDPYAAATLLWTSQADYASVLISLAGAFKEELALIGAIRRRLPHVEVWVAHTDGRPATLAEAMRLGAEGLLADDGLHRLASAVDREPEPAPAAPASALPIERVVVVAETPAMVGEPVLTAEELRALLAAEPVAPEAGR